MVHALRECKQPVLACRRFFAEPSGMPAAIALFEGSGDGRLHFGRAVEHIVDALARGAPSC
jgi:hypothetical protein